MGRSLGATSIPLPLVDWPPVDYKGLMPGSSSAPWDGRGAMSMRKGLAWAARRVAGAALGRTEDEIRAGTGRRWKMAASAALLLAGCAGGGSVAVPQQFPVPLVEKLPLPMGIYLDEALTGYVHKEAIEGQGEWSIDLGSAQRPMFDALLRGLFIGHRFVASASAANPNVAGILAPSIEELQFTTPKQTRSEYHEVWIRYRFQLHDNQGNALGEWELTAYGKSHRQNHGMASNSLQAAALDACRDAMADFALRFARVPVVQAWLAGELEDAA